MLLKINIFLAITALEVSSPVKKVITLLGDLETKIQNEAKEEEKTYNKFERFCREETANKNDAIATGKGNRDQLESQIDNLNSRKIDAEEREATAKSEIERLNTELAEEKDRRKKEKETYTKNELDLSEAVSAVRNAIDSLEASRSMEENARSFLQVSKHREMIQKALIIADALGISKHTDRLIAFIQNAPENNRKDYEFHSDGILKTLKDLQKDLVDEKLKLDQQESTDNSNSQMTVLRNRKDHKEQERQQAKEAELIQKLAADIASSTQQLADVNMKLDDDQKYLDQLTVNCDDKAKTFDQRVKMRNDELKALGEAKSIISDQVAIKVTDQTVRLIEIPQEEMVSKKRATSFLQVQKSVPLQDRERVSNIIRMAGIRNDSVALTNLASKVMGQNFFKKIIGMIEDKIIQLQKQAQEDQDHNNFCKKQTDLATQQRDIRANEIKSFNQELEQGEAHRDQLIETLEVLKAEIDELEKAYNYAADERSEESSENKKAVADATAGKDALKKAEDVLRRFYEDVGAKGKVALVSRPKGKDYPDAPDAGFKNHEAYKGSQGASKGILGMIDVIASDFQRTIDETKKQEHAAKLAFSKMWEGGNMASQDEKKKLKEIAENDKAENVAKIEENMDALVKSQELLDKSIEELGDLYKQCVETEMSYEERVARREDEIQSLKQALCILDKEGPVQTGEC